MSKSIPFEEIVLGEELGPLEYEADGSAVAQYCRDWDDHNPLFTETSSLGGPMAPPAFMAGLTCFHLLRTKYDSSGTLDAKTEHENLKPLPVGGKMIVKGRIADKFIRRGLEYVVVESECYDDGGDLLRRSRDHVVLGVDRVTEKAA